MCSAFESIRYITLLDVYKYTRYIETSIDVFKIEMKYIKKLRNIFKIETRCIKIRPNLSPITCHL